jgi:hypothetical protein
MDQATHNKIVSFICGIADDVLRDLFKRGLQIDSHLYGHEINPKTSAVCKADMLLRGEGADGWMGPTTSSVARNGPSSRTTPSRPKSSIPCSPTRP